MPTRIDKADIPYIYHPIHLAMQTEDETSCVVALLHDVVEDTNITFEDLEKDFPSEIIEVLKLLTHNKSESYIDYIKNIKQNPIAKKIKIADIKHNSDESRLNEVDTKAFSRRKKIMKH